MSPTHAVFASVALSTSLRSELGNGHSRLRTTIERRGSAVIIYAGGEVDAANADTWGRLLREAAAAVVPPGPLVVDTNEVDFMGCCAYAALADEADRRRGTDVCLVSRQSIVARVVAVGRLGARLRVYTNVDGALAATTPAPELLLNA
jgi:anti-anti-sigma factor